MRSVRNSLIGWLIFGIVIVLITTIAPTFFFQQSFPFGGSAGGPFGGFDALGIIIPIVVVAIIILSVLPFLRMLSPAKIKDGIPASAKILEVRDTGASINDNPMVQLLLEVRPAGAAPYQATAKALVSRLKVGYLMPGGTVQVIYDAHKPERVEITEIDAPTPNVDSPTSAGGPAAALEQLAALHGKGLITDEEFQQKRAEVLRTM
ncbi:SHOCT domain-containing protein [Chloroflexia bacterium SDU3-3]|nr:SHOCT domain-containing protein [Chloroflexia bacterium SDU3-3]